MQLRSFIYSYNVFVSFGILVLTRKDLGACNPITNSNFNEHIRDFSSKENSTNITEVKALQKEDPKRYSDSAPFRPIHLKDVPDNKLSSSSHGWSSQISSRGLINRDHPGYYTHDYEEYPQVGYGYEYHVPIPDHNAFEHHNLDHYHYGHGAGGHHYNIGPHYKHYNHALAAKAVLWPIAGIALLGAAAALVSNPILLQLGVASGKRRRRDTEEITGPDLDVDFTKFNSQEENINKGPKKIVKGTSSFQRKALINKGLNFKLLSKNNPPTQSPGDFNFIAPISSESYDNNFVPVPITLKHA